MKTKISFAVITLLLISMLFTNNLFAQNTKETIEGSIVGIDWDEEDNTIAVAISVVIPTEDEEEDQVIDYIVENNKVGKELLKYEGERVQATGTVSSDENGNLMIAVEKYQIIE